MECSGEVVIEKPTSTKLENKWLAVVFALSNQNDVNTLAKNGLLNKKSMQNVKSANTKASVFIETSMLHCGEYNLNKKSYELVLAFRDL